VGRFLVLALLSLFVWCQFPGLVTAADALHGSSSAPAATPPTSLTWGAATSLPEHAPYTSPGSLGGLSCPSRILCFAAGAIEDRTNGIAAVASGSPGSPASTWTLTRLPGPSASDDSAVSCPSTTLCVVAEESGWIVASTDPRGPSSAWHLVRRAGSSQLPIGDDILSCGSPDLCALADQRGLVHISTDPTAPSHQWRTYQITDTSLSAISCPSVSLCVAIDDAGNVITSLDPASPSVHWSPPRKIDAAGLTDISCSGSRLCVVVDSNGRVLSSTDPASVRPAWTAPKRIDAQRINRVSCFSASRCAAGDDLGRVLVSSQPALDRWTRPASGPFGGAVGVSCPSSQVCAVAILEGTVFSVTDLGRPRPQRTAPQAVMGTNALQSISCAPGICAATDDGGHVYTAAVSGGRARTWHVANNAATPSSAYMPVACASARLCVAVKYRPYGGVALLMSAEPLSPNQRWSQTVLPGPAGGLPAQIACPTTHLCVATRDNEVYVSDDPTAASSWKAFALPLPFAVASLSCTSPGFCAVLSSSHSSADLAVSFDLAAGAAGWHRVKNSPTSGADDISCSAPGQCVELYGEENTFGNAFTVSPALASAGTARFESSAYVGESPGVTSWFVSCATRQTCVAVNDDGASRQATESSTGHLTWSASAAIYTPAGRAGVIGAYGPGFGLSCSSRICAIGLAADGVVLGAVR